MEIFPDIEESGNQGAIFPLDGSFRDIFPILFRKIPKCQFLNHYVLDIPFTHFIINLREKL